MAGNKNSGRRPRTLTQQETRAALQGLSRKSVEVIHDALHEGNVQVAQWVIEHVVGKPKVHVEESASLDVRVQATVLDGYTLGELKALLRVTQEQREVAAPMPVASTPAALPPPNHDGT